MSIYHKIFNKEIADIYAAVKSAQINDILHGPEELYVVDANNNKVRLNVIERRVAADAITRIARESNIEPTANETVEDYVLRASVTDILKESEELESLRKQAAEVGI